MTLALRVGVAVRLRGAPVGLQLMQVAVLHVGPLGRVDGLADADPEIRWSLGDWFVPSR